MCPCKKWKWPGRVRCTYQNNRLPYDLVFRSFVVSQIALPHFVSNGSGKRCLQQSIFRQGGDMNPVVRCSVKKISYLFYFNFFFSYCHSLNPHISFLFLRFEGLKPQGLIYPWVSYDPWIMIFFFYEMEVALFCSFKPVSVRQWPLSACLVWCMLGQCENSSGGTWWRVCWYTPIHTRMRTCTHIDVNRSSDKSALVAWHVSLQREPDAGLSLDPMTLTLTGALLWPFLVLLNAFWLLTSNNEQHFSFLNACWRYAHAHAGELKNKLSKSAGVCLVLLYAPVMEAVSKDVWVERLWCWLEVEFLSLALPESLEASKWV